MDTPLPAQPAAPGKKTLVPQLTAKDLQDADNKLVQLTQHHFHSADIIRLKREGLPVPFISSAPSRYNEGGWPLTKFSSVLQ